MLPKPKNEFDMNKKLKNNKNVNPIQESNFKNLLYLFTSGTKSLFIVSIAIHANKGADKKLPVIAAKTKSLTPIPPDFARSSAINEAKI